MTRYNVRKITQVVSELWPHDLYLVYVALLSLTRIYSIINVYHWVSIFLKVSEYHKINFTKIQYIYITINKIWVLIKNIRRWSVTSQHGAGQQQTKCLWQMLFGFFWTSYLNWKRRFLTISSAKIGMLKKVLSIVYINVFMFKIKVIFLLN